MIRKYFIDALTRPVSRSRWEFAQSCEQEYQRNKQATLQGNENAAARLAANASRAAARLLHQLGIDPGHGVVAEIGSGTQGLIWGWDAGQRIAVDPLADLYQELFTYQRNSGVEIRTARGENIPLDSESVDLLLSDNVLDHVQDPGKFLAECRRVLAPTGHAYFTVDVHHPVWGLGALTYNLLFSLGIKMRNFPAYPHHPFHFTSGAAETLFERAQFDIIWQSGGQPVKYSPSTSNNIEQKIKTTWYKNARLQLVCKKQLT